jgi:hypothetical protein
MSHARNFYKGLMFAILFSIPLWIAFIGWAKLIWRLFD